MDKPGGGAGTPLEPGDEFMDLGIDAAVALVMEPEHRVVRRFGDIGLEDQPSRGLDQAPRVDTAELTASVSENIPTPDGSGPVHDFCDNRIAELETLNAESRGELVLGCEPVIDVDHDVVGPVGDRSTDVLDNIDRTGDPTTAVAVHHDREVVSFRGVDTGRTVPSGVRIVM